MIKKTNTFTSRKQLESPEQLSAFLGDFQTHRLEKMNVLGVCKNLQIVNPESTFLGLYRACQFLEQLNKQKKRPLHVLFLNANPEFSTIVKNNAIFCNQYYINTKWVGGTLTNWKQVSQSIQAFQSFQSKWKMILKTQDIEFPRLRKYKKCFLGFLGQQSQSKCDSNGIDLRRKLQLFEFEKKQNMKLFDITTSQSNQSLYIQKPDILVIVDPSSQQVAIEEARSENIPVIALVNSDICTKDIVYPIIGNNQNQSFVAFCIGWIARILKSF